MTRKLTLTLELPEDLAQALEDKARREDRPLQEVLADHLAHHARRPHPLTASEIARRKAAFERHLGAWDSGDAGSSDNQRIDADLAREYADRHE